MEKLGFLMQLHLLRKGMCFVSFGPRSISLTIAPGKNKQTD
jgi:hypothetical protein